MSSETSIPEVAKRYAKAAFDLADAENASVAILEDLTALKKMINDNEELSRLILSPTFTSTDQISVM
ncbi:MAG: F0F1 ATP synthase subunit delta, partial [Pseudomonadota bacterium]|nr:F0F1 ATP synthase subunit delta [Pseudomonadota bacterium]